MKAIVVLFDGKITSKAMEKDIVGTIASQLNNMVPNLNSLSISVLDSKSICNAVLNSVVDTNSDEALVEEFIKEAIEHSKIEVQTISQWKFVQWVISEQVQKKHKKALAILTKDELTVAIQKVISDYNVKPFVVWLHNIKECLIYI